MVQIQVWKRDRSQVKRYLKNFESIRELAAFYNNAPKDRNYGYFEFIDSGPQKLYLDIDLPKEDCSFSDKQSWENMLVDQCKLIEDHLKHPEILVFDQSTDKKYSSHIIVKNFYAESNVLARRFYNSCRLISGADENVYHARQAFRMWGSFKANNDSEKKEILFRFSEGKRQEVGVGSLELSETLIGFTAGTYIYRNDDESLDRKRNSSKCKSGKKSDRIIVELNKLIFLEEGRMVNVEYEAINPSKLGTSPPVNVGGGYLVPLTYEGNDKLIIVTNTEKYWKYQGKRFSNDFIGFKINPDNNFSKSYNTICDFVVKEIESGKFDRYIPDISIKIGKINKIKKIDASKEAIYSKISNESSFFYRNKEEIPNFQRLPDFQESTKGQGIAVCVRMRSFFMKDNTVTINIGLYQLVVENPKFKKEADKVQSMIVDLGKLKV
ncbi:hypothetical protein GGI25_004225 [Coemansia spiralis]|uniref:Uncharacterized protein n=2 Tax=Coemansia TaxID=4863 RepID=A0A9W8KXK9_9FUNG|nr:hypothetical protein EDC05_005672 [Coemansia umbellata]KAJ2619433.1 hypothetical protein GGI26_005833 [Coemansia sp. RSA 1358]KAJ2674762.1 hypothetical protein GGI25_004225 [Coemansia spiralis]